MIIFIYLERRLGEVPFYMNEFALILLLAYFEVNSDDAKND